MAIAKNKKQLKTSSNTWNSVPAYLFHHLRPQLEKEGNGLAFDSEIKSRSLFNDQEAINESHKTAASTLAFLHDLLEYAQNHLQAGNAYIKLEGLEQRFHQPFGELHRYGATQSQEVRQIQVCTEVLRAQLGVRPLAEAEQEAALVAAETAYLEAVYRSLLLYIGTSYEELEQVVTADEATRAALARRLGIAPAYLGENWKTREDLSESWLEQQFGLPDTNADGISEGIKQNDESNQLKHWFFNGLQWGISTDELGQLHLHLRNTNNRYLLEVYKDAARTQLLASGESDQPQSTIELEAVNDSGLSGSMDIQYSVDTDAIVITVFPTFLSRRLQQVHERWQALEDPDSQEGLQFREELEQAARSGLKNAVDKAAEAHLPMLRDALIAATGQSPRHLGELLLIGCEYEASVKTTRIWQAITSLQQLLTSLRSGLLLDTHPELQLNAPDFEEEWQWVGSYESWRSAMMVFLYPENLLNPGLRREQTPTLQQVAENLRKRRNFTAEEAYIASNAYSTYFRDVCQLKVQASCTTEEKGFYQFGRGNGRVYWAAYGRAQDKGSKQSSWIKVPGFDGYGVYKILGAVSYRNSEEKSHIYLFALAIRTEPSMYPEHGDYLLYNRYELETGSWEWEEASLLQSFPVAPAMVLEQRISEMRAPRLVYRYANGNLKLRKLNREGTGWRGEVPAIIDPKNGDIQSIHALVYAGAKNRLFVQFSDNSNRMGTIVVEDLSPSDSENPEEDHDFLQAVINDYEATGAGHPMGVIVDSPNTVWQFFTINGRAIYRLISMPAQNEVQVHAQNEGPAGLSALAIHCGLQEERISGTGPIPSPELRYGFRIAYQNTGEEAGQFHRLCERKGGDSLEWFSAYQIVPNEVHFFQLRPDKDVSSSARKQEIETAFANNINAPASILNYLWEAWYFLPVLVATQLQRSRQYAAAKDWYRLVYDYRLPIADRKLFYGLQEEENRTDDYQVPDNWQSDPLNPHIIAAGRENAYTRFTLYSLIRCFLQEADLAFTRDTSESLAAARSLYSTALEFLETPVFQQESLYIDDQWEIPPNPVTALLRFHAENNLHKIHSSRNIAGDVREVSVLTSESAISLNYLANGSGGNVVSAPAVHLRPTVFRYAVLIERAKYLAGMAQQMEASFLSTLEKLDAERLNLLNAKNDLDLSRTSIRLQELRLKEAYNGIKLTVLQTQRAQLQREHFQTLINEGYSNWEIAALVAQASAAAMFASGSWKFWEADSTLGSAFQATSSLLQTIASFERRKQEWEFQYKLSNHEMLIGQQQERIAYDQLKIVQQEQSVAMLRSAQAKEVANFLLTKFASAELYKWMSDVLEDVYSFFLQQAAATGQLATQQLAFERQEPIPAVVLSDYWEAPQNGQTGATNSNGTNLDRRGLTGSARLLKDLNQLDQMAFQTDRRKLQLSKTISLAQLSPAEFQRFRETGRLPFHTPMELFDRDFPGHYLRLIRRVRVSVIALTPPVEGIKASLSSNGISRVDLPTGIFFQTTEIRRPPESIAFTSPLNATGLFELQADDGKLLPFESMGVDTFWELQLPKAANFFDFNSIADVLLTIEYTALNSPDHRRQLIEQMDRHFSADRAFSFRQEFPDQWYDFHHPELSDTPMIVTFDTRRSDFPANLEDLRIKQLVLYFSHQKGSNLEESIRHLKFTPEGADQPLGNGDQNLISQQRIFSTRSGNFSAWDDFITGGLSPYGKWEIALPNEEQILNRFREEQIVDILFVITFEARTAAWPD